MDSLFSSDQNIILFLVIFFVILVINALLWVNLFRKVGYDGRLSLVLISVISFFMVGSNYGILVIYLTLIFLAITRWPVQEKLEDLKAKKKKKKSR